jgi:hypothetical protein
VVTSLSAPSSFCLLGVPQPVPYTVIPILSEMNIVPGCDVLECCELLRWVCCVSQAAHGVQHSHVGYPVSQQCSHHALSDPTVFGQKFFPVTLHSDVGTVT